MRRRIFAVIAGAAALVGATQAQAAGAPTFSTPTALTGATGFEPSVGTDGHGNLVDAAPQGFPSGQGAYWFSHNDGATWSGPTILGGPTGGGDEDVAFAPYDGTTYAGQLYITDLAASHATVCYSKDHGTTFWAVGTGPNSLANTPDPQQCHSDPLGVVGPSNDRQWLTVDKGGRAYLSYHEFNSAQPMAFTTSNGGGDGFAQTCGSIIDPTNPLIEQYVPQDITGGTLISKPVVDSAGNLYELITTTTQQENVGAAGTSVSGTFSEVFLAVSTDHCATFKDYTVFDGYGSNLPCNLVATCNTDQFGDIFNQVAIDSAGDLYAVAAGYVGDTPFATTTDAYMFTHKVSDPLGTWTGPTKLTNDGQGHMLPTLTAGPTPGQLAVGFFRTINNVPNPNDTSGMWTYTVLETQNALTASPNFSFTDMKGGGGTSSNVYHTGDICNAGLLCGVAPNAGSDRSLGDFTSAVMDSDGCPIFSFAGVTPATSGATLTFVTKQTSNCFVGLAANVPEAPLAGVLVAAGLGVATAVGVRRRRGTRGALTADS